MEGERAFSGELMQLWERLAQPGIGPEAIKPICSVPAAKKEGG